MFCIHIAIGAWINTEIGGHKNNLFFVIWEKYEKGKKVSWLKMILDKIKYIKRKKIFVVLGGGKGNEILFVIQDQICFIKWNL